MSGSCIEIGPTVGRVKNTDMDIRCQSRSGEEPEKPGDAVVVGHDGEAAMGEEPGEADGPEAEEDDDGGAGDAVGGELRRFAADALDDLVDPEEREIREEEGPERVVVEGVAETAVGDEAERTGDAAAGAGHAQQQEHRAEDGAAERVGKIKKARCQ